MRIRQQRNSKPKERLWFLADPELKLKLMEIAYKEGKSLSLVIREMVEAGLKCRKDND